MHCSYRSGKTGKVEEKSAREVRENAELPEKSGKMKIGLCQLLKNCCKPDSVTIQLILLSASLILPY